ncbi:hypothetical protein ACFLY2_02480 [Patescibacteria group bacterium]
MINGLLVCPFLLSVEEAPSFVGAGCGFLTMIFFLTTIFGLVFVLSAQPSFEATFE